jgi:subtilisin family serine protease
MRRTFASGGCSLLALVMVAGTAVAAPVAWKNPKAAEHAEAMSPEQVLRDSAGSRVVVRLAATPTSAERATLAEAGVTLLAPLGNGAYFARVGAGVDAAQAAGRLAGAMAVRPEYKMHERIQVDAELPQWAVLSTGRSDDASITPTNPLVAAYVVLHADVDAASPDMDGLLSAHNGVVKDVVQSVNALVVEAPLDQIRRLAMDDRVQWIEPPLPRMETYNDSNRALVQANEAQSAPYNLDGSGVTVFVYDGDYIRATHSDFGGRATVIDSSGQATHATHVAATIGGEGAVILNNRGMAPGVNILSAGFEYDGTGIFLYTNPGDAEADYSNAMSMGASISNNSIGSNIGPNGFGCQYEGDYGVMAATIDNMIRGSLGDSIIIFWAAGNERGSSCGTGYNTSPPPANNKNAITVGALNSNNDTMTSFSSWGPSDDGRIRPVISAPGCQSNGDGGVTSASSTSNTAYTALCGTSMASPTAAGVGALVLQDFRNHFSTWGDPSNQLMKAFMIHGAADIITQGPDFQTGYGSIRAVDTIDFVRTGQFDEASVEQAGAATFTVNVSATDPQLKITVVWDDAAGTPNVSPALVNDLDLIVTDPNGVRHYPWTLDPANPSASARRDREDHLNNIEQVQVDNPTPGTWLVEVRGTEVPVGPQSFAIAASPSLGDGYLAMGLATEVPDLIAPGQPLNVQAVAFEGIDSLVPGSVELHYRTSGGAYTTVAMSDLGSVFDATIPGALCGGAIDFFITAEGTFAGAVSLPPSGAGDPFHSEVGVFSMIYTENFEAANGWAVSGDAVDGQWTRGIPVDCTSRAAPGADSDGSGQCWLTDNSAAASCNSDVDTGTTILTSPTLDFSGGGTFTYDYWFADIPTGPVQGDEFGVDVSTNNGSTWTRVRTVTSASTAWRTDSIEVGEEVPASATFRVRFSANDLGTQNVIEAAVDNLRFSRIDCVNPPTCPADLAEPFGTLNFFDVSAFLAAYNGQDPAADFAEPFGTFNFFDVSAFLGSYNAGCP